MPAVAARSLSPDTLSDVLFTSGTTGKPKGVMLTHAETLRVFYDWSRSIGLRPGDRALIVNPFFHVFGCKAGFLSALIRGATVIPKRTFDVVDVLATIDRERVSFYPVRRPSIRRSSTTPTGIATTSARCAWPSPAPPTCRQS